MKIKIEEVTKETIKKWLMEKAREQFTVCGRWKEHVVEMEVNELAERLMLIVHWDREYQKGEVVSMGRADVKKKSTITKKGEDDNNISQSDD